MSGLAAAERLGAEYPFASDKLAASQFDMFLSLAHGKRRRRPSLSSAAEPMKIPQTEV